MAEIQIKIILDAAHIGQTEAYCRSLSEMGLRVEETFPEIGVIFGAGSATLLPRMRDLSGVAEAVAEGKLRAVEEDGRDSGPAVLTSRNASGATVKKT
jgi:hypothetical protein